MNFNGMFNFGADSVPSVVPTTPTTPSSTAPVFYPPPPPNQIFIQNFVPVSTNPGVTYGGIEKKRVYTLTFGDRGENHIGMEIIGQEAPHGLKPELLETIRNMYSNNSEMIDLDRLVNQNLGAKVLILRNGVSLMDYGYDLINNLLKEQDNIVYDSKYYSVKHGRVVNKNARHNVCFNKEGRAPNLEKGMGTIVGYDSVPYLKYVWEQLGKLIGYSNLIIEGNKYYDVDKTGIGWHGDTERKIVIGLRLGASMPLVFRAYHKNQIISPKIELILNSGDIYFMSEKASGNDWKKSSLITFRHAAGSEKYIG